MISEIIMPSLFENMIEGTLGSWHKNEGDPVNEGRQLVSPAKLQGQLVGLLLGPLPRKAARHDQPRAVFLREPVGLLGISFDPPERQEVRPRGLRKGRG